MKVLVIGEQQRRQIAAAKQKAAKRPIKMETLRDMQFTEDRSVQHLSDRPANFNRPPTHSVDIPFGFRAAYSIEEQPVGICAHLSIGTEGRRQKGAMPSEQVVKMIAEAFGISYPPNMRMWVEEYEPGEFAINLLHLLEAPKEGHA